MVWVPGVRGSLDGPLQSGRVAERDFRIVHDVIRVTGSRRLIQTIFQSLGNKSNLRLQKKVLVIAFDVVSLQPSRSVRAPAGTRISRLPQRLVARTEKNDPACVRPERVVFFSLQTRLSDLLHI